MREAGASSPFAAVRVRIAVHSRKALPMMAIEHIRSVSELTLGHCVIETAGKKRKISAPVRKAVLLAMVWELPIGVDLSWKSIESIKNETELTRRAVQLAVRSLEGQGLLTRTGSRRNRSHVYHVNVIQRTKGESSTPYENETEATKGVPTATKGVPTARKSEPGTPNGSMGTDGLSLLREWARITNTEPTEAWLHRRRKPARDFREQHLEYGDSSLIEFLKWAHIEGAAEPGGWSAWWARWPGSQKKPRPDCDRCGNERWIWVDASNQRTTEDDPDALRAPCSKCSDEEALRAS
jgi:hypothetical protein